MTPVAEFEGRLPDRASSTKRSHGTLVVETLCAMALRGPPAGVPGGWASPRT